VRLDIEAIYDNYLDHKIAQEKKRRKKRGYWFSASTAGSCYKKQKFAIDGTDEFPLEPRVKRLLRLGTLVHKDFEDAINWQFKKFGVIDDDEKPNWSGEEIHTEYDIEIPDIRVKGRLDNVIISDNVAYIGDIKTMGTYPWRKKFGRKRNRDESNTNYNLQLGTYALGIAEKDNVDYVFLNIDYYNKDNSNMKSVEVEPEWAGKALKYWKDCNDAVKEELTPAVTEGVPFQKEWECNYCAFNYLCNSPYIKEKKG
jgi:CRISPR/Cas system-associated exonuclease Cas4 (RecB family)